MIANNEIKKRAREILEKMSLKDKIGQVTQLNFDASDIEKSCQMIRDICPGSLILCWSAMGGNEGQQAVCTSYINRLQKTAVEETPAGIPLLFGRDVIHGHKVAFPVPLTFTSSYDFDLINKCYNAIREEAVNDGINWTFSPMLDVARDPRWGRIVEGTGEDPYLGELYAKASVKGFQTEDLSNDGAMLACAKHFIGYGASEGGRDYNHTEISDYSLQNYYLPAFRSAINSDVATVMSSFNELNGIPTSGNRKIFTEILRGQLGFEGFVISDWDAVWQLCKYSGFAENRADAARIALNAGVDMDMMCCCYIENIEALIDEGRLTMEELDTAVLRILETKLCAELFEKPYFAKVEYDIQDHLDLALKAAEESIVLLKNKNNILPLNPKGNFGFSGNFRDEAEELVGTWSLDYDKTLLRTIREGILNTAPECKLADCIDTDAYKVNAVNNSDCILVVIGENRKLTGEANSIADISLSPCTKALIQSLKSTGKPLVGVFCFARPMAFGDVDGLFDAILYCGHAGTRAADAIANILFGKAKPCGRLPFTLPYNQGQLPIYYNCPPGSRKINSYYGDVFASHSNYHDCTGAPLYPFGYGLSYTQFNVSEIECQEKALSLKSIENGDSFKLSVKVDNIGNNDGVAVLQLYVYDLCASRVRPLRVLRNIRRLALSQNESKEITFELKKEDLGFYLENGEFITEKGKFKVYIGENCLTDNLTEIEII